MALTRRGVWLGGAAAALWPGGVEAAPRARLISEQWTRFGTAADPPHGAWDALLAAHSRRGGDGIMRFAYGAAPKDAVAGYVDALAALDPTRLTAGAAFAYWVNLYNALTVRTVQEAYPVDSIREIGGGLFSRGPWREKRVRVAGADLSLDDIEHGILRPVWGDPRVHYAVNCAALGCPDLADRAYRSDRLGAMLNAGAARYVNHRRGVALTDGRLEVSSIYRWFAEDFGGSDAAVIAHLAQYAKPSLQAALAGVTRISGDRYDWALNGFRA